MTGGMGGEVGRIEGLRGVYIGGWGLGFEGR